MKKKKVTISIDYRVVKNGWLISRYPDGSTVSLHGSSLFFSGAKEISTMIQN